MIGTNNTDNSSIGAHPVLELQNIEKHYSEPGGEGIIPVLRGVSLSVHQGESVAVTGPSGSGKSTLLNLMGALDHPSSGVVIFSGRNLQSLSDRELAILRNREVGFVFQLHLLLPQCTVLENVLIPTIPKHDEIKLQDRVSRATELLEMVGLESHMHHRPGQLSGGERQRAAVVRALINRPKLLLADEPTGSLDQDSAVALAKLLTGLNEEHGVSLVMVTHAPFIAQFMKRQLRLEHGTLVE